VRGGAGGIKVSISAHKSSGTFLGVGILSIYQIFSLQTRPKHIGIVACSAEGAALCYRTICIEAAQFIGEHNHPEITMHTYPLSDYMAHIEQSNWEQVGQMMLSSVHKLVRAGAEFAICPDNTIHQAFEFVVDKSPIPFLHIAHAVAEEARSFGFKRLGILGTRYLMEGPVYSETLKEYGLISSIPEPSDREQINMIIFKELVNGIISEASRLYFNQVISKLKDDGCDAVVLGCTEIPLIVRPDEAVLPTLDSTRLLARFALREALG
jgi:aspartate racemase